MQPAPPRNTIELIPKYGSSSKRKITTQDGCQVGSGGEAWAQNVRARVWGLEFVAGLSNYDQGLRQATPSTGFQDVGLSPHAGRKVL